MTRTSDTAAVNPTAVVARRDNISPRRIVAVRDR
jgi:hypothetical protein